MLHVKWTLHTYYNNSNDDDCMSSVIITANGTRMNDFSPNTWKQKGHEKWCFRESTYIYFMLCVYSATFLFLVKWIALIWICCETHFSLKTWEFPFLCYVSSEMNKYGSFNMHFYFNYIKYCWRMHFIKKPCISLSMKIIMQLLNQYGILRFYKKLLCHYFVIRNRGK